MKTVSVAMCTYNGERFIVAQLDSLLSQSYPIKEIIVCDDCSTDSTAGILQAYSKKHPGLFRIIINEKNLGYIKNFEKAVSLCSGDFIALADQDDVWESNKIADLVVNIGSFDLIHSDTVLIDDSDNVISDSYCEVENKINKIASFFDLLNQNRVTGCTCMFSKHLFLRSFPFSVDLPHDHYLALCAYLGNGIAYLDKKLTKYRQHDNNVIGAIRKKKSKKVRLSRFEFNKAKVVFYKNIGEHFKYMEYKNIADLCKKYHDYYNSYFTHRIRIRAFIFHLSRYNEFSMGKTVRAGARGLLRSFIGIKK